MSRATDFLIITGSIAMIFFLVILVMIIGILLRVKSGIAKVEQVTNQLQERGNIPLNLLERRLQTKEKPMT